MLTRVVNPVGIKAVRYPKSRWNKRIVADNVSCYCMIELINTSSDVLKIGKNVKLGEGDPIELLPDEADNSNVCANMHNCDQEVSTAGNDRSLRDALGDALDKKLRHLSSA
jgi:hypothetical protein